MNPEKWEDSDTMDSNSGVMVSNLPLIFAHGEPVSLNKMTLDELQVFVPFMVSCSIGEDPKIDWSQLRRPVWWPKKHPFRLPSASKARMVQLVVDCYTFHGCQYLLQFCATLHQMKPAGGYKFTDNRDGTTSMYNGHNGKLLVTFRNENREYDLVRAKAKNQSSTQKKRLLSNLPLNKKKSDAMVQPPNVYLCDKCDDEFLSFREVQAHEKHCKGNSPSTPPLPSPEPEDPEEEELDPAEQVPFLSYFGLQPAKHTGIQPYTSPRKRQQSVTSVKKFYNHSYLLDISSPMGKYILSRTKYGGRLQMPEHFVTRYERHIMRSSEADLVNLRERNSSRWIVVYRPRKEQQWVHTYCFNSEQKKERTLTVQTGLDRRSRILLASCQRVRLKVKLKRLAKKVVDRYTRRGGSGAHVPCIDLTGGEDHHDRPVYQRSPAPSSSSLSSMLYHSPADKYLPSLDSSNFSYLQNDAAAVAGSLLYYNPLVPSATDIGNPSKFECTENSKISGALTDPLNIDEKYISNYNNSFSGNLAPSVSSLSLLKREKPNQSESSLSQDVLNFLSKNTQNKISALSNNGVTVTSLNCNLLQSDSSSLDIFNSAKSHAHRANSKSSSSSAAKHKLTMNNFSSCTSSNNDTRNVSNNSYSNHSHSSKITPTGISNTTTGNSNSLLNKNHNEVSMVEVIELSSDDEDSLAQDKRSYAGSKNGYSHWPLEEPSFISGRDRRSLMSNGVTQDSVLPPPSYFLSSTSDKPFFSSSFFHPSNIPNYINGEKEGNVFPLTVDSEGIIKAPLKVDEDVTFNFPLSNQTNNGYINNLFSYYSTDNTVINNNNNSKYINNNNNNDDDFSIVNNNCNQYSNNILYSLASKVNKGLQYLSTFVKSKVCENTSPPCNISKNDDDSRQPFKPFDIVDEDIKNSPLSTTTKRSREMSSLLSDECRELKRRGIEMLEQLNDERVMTRCNAEKTLNQMFAFSEDKYSDLSSEFEELQQSDLNEVLDENIFCTSDTIDHMNDVENCEISLPKDSCNITANGIHNNNISSLSSHFPINSSSLLQKEKEFYESESYHSPIRMVKEKKTKVCRELINLARDECKELRGMGFHPGDLLGSSERYTPLVLEEDEPTPSLRARSSLLSSYKQLSKKSVAADSEFNSVSSVKKIMQGNKKLSRELSKLVRDEWKELKRDNAHPSQIKNVFSAERNVRSNSAYKRNKPTLMKRSSSNRGKIVFGRNLRGQDTSAVETWNENPRIFQRKLIRSENGMCVLNYFAGDMSLG